MKTEKLLLIGGLGVAAYYLYTKYASGSAGTLQPQAVPLNNSTIPQTVTNQLTAASSLSGQYGSDVPINPNATIAQQATLFNWATAAMGTKQPGDLAQFMKMYSLFTATDIAGLLDLINTSFAPSPAHTSFWNNWRAQYDIDNGTYS
jgi:hypothetical protein